MFQEAKSGFIFTTKEIWEQWTITLNVTPKLVCPSDTTSILTQKLFDIITNAQTNSEAQYVQFADRFSSVVCFTTHNIFNLSRNFSLSIFFIFFFLFFYKGGIC